MGNGRKMFLRVLFRRRELTEPHSILGANSVSSVKNSVGSLWHTNNRLKGTHWDSGRPKKLTEFGVWNRTLRNHIRPVSGWMWRRLCGAKRLNIFLSAWGTMTISKLKMSLSYGFSVCCLCFWVLSADKSCGKEMALPLWTFNLALWSHLRLHPTKKETVQRMSTTNKQVHVKTCPCSTAY